MGHLTQRAHGCRFAHPREQRGDQRDGDDRVRKHEDKERALIGRQPLRDVSGLGCDEVRLGREPGDDQESDLIHQDETDRPSRE